MIRRTSFWNFVKYLTNSNLKGPDFLGFLGILLLIFPLSIPGYAHADNPMKDQINMLSILIGLICGIFFAYLVTQKFTKEFENRTINILLSTPLGRSKIFIGKIISILLMIPLVIFIILLAFIISLSNSGKISNIFLIHIFQILFVLTLFLFSIVVFSMLISLWLKKAGSVLIIMAIYIFTFFIIGPLLGLSWGSGGQPLINFPMVLLFPSSMYIIELLLIQQNLMLNWLLVSMQLCYIITFLFLGIVLFRRIQIWN